MIVAFTDRPPAGRGFRASWERMSVYLPVILMALIALGTYWLARNTPTAGTSSQPAAPTHDPDSYMRRFSVKSFDANGRLKSELQGVEARHYPDTDTTEIDQPRMRAIGADGDVTLATAQRAVSNADGSEVQLFGHAVVMRDPPAGAPAKPHLEIRGEYLHIFVQAERVTSNKPVELIRGKDHLQGDGLIFDNVTQVLEMAGRVHGTFVPRAP